MSGAGFGPLHLDLLNRKQRVEDRRSNGFHASVVIGDTDDKYLSDAETFVFASGVGDLRPPYIGRGNHAARGRIVGFAIDGIDRCPRVAVVERDEALHLFLAVTDEAWADLNFLRLCCSAEEQSVQHNEERRRDAWREAHDGLRSKPMFRTGLRTHRAQRGLGRAGPVDLRIWLSTTNEQMNSRTKSGVIDLHSSLIFTPRFAIAPRDLREYRSAGWLAPLFNLFGVPEMALRGLRSLVRACFDLHESHARAMLACHRTTTDHNRRNSGPIGARSAKRPPGNEFSSSHHGDASSDRLNALPCVVTTGSISQGPLPPPCSACRSSRDPVSSPPPRFAST